MSKTLVYKYGLLPPTMGLSVVDEQLGLAHRYYNRLIEIERIRRTAGREMVSSHADIAPLEAEVAEIDGRVQAAIAEIKTQRAATRSRSDTEAQRGALAALRPVLKAARARLKAAKTALREDTEVVAQYARLREEAHASQIEARASCGVYWGTYLQIENAAEQAAEKAIDLPEFRRWTGEGLVAVQIQKGMDEGALLGCQDTRVRLDRCPRKVGAGKSRPTVSLRVASEGRDPVWAEWPIVFHRGLPPRAAIMWAVVKRERLAGKDRWSLHLSLRLPDEFRREECGTGAVALDIGWRKRDEAGGIRAGVLRDEGGKEREVLLWESDIAHFQKCDDLRAIRDMHFDTMRDGVNAWLRIKPRDLSPMLAEAAQHISAWKSPARLDALVDVWTGNPVPGDEDIYPQLLFWRKRERHLWQWESSLRDKVHRRRKEEYRIVAAGLARQYKTLIVEKFDLSVMQRHHAPEAEEGEIKAVRLQQRRVAPSELRECCIQAFAARGGQVVEVRAALTTMACHACGAIEIWDHAAELEHRCSACGAVWDQDANAAENMLAIYREWRGGDPRHRVVAHRDYAVVQPPKAGRWATRKTRSQQEVQPSDARGGI
jgi:hypothetical protein